MALSKKASFRVAARSFGYRMGKAADLTEIENGAIISFSDLYQPYYAEEALVGFWEGVARHRSGFTKDTWRKTHDS